ncbi:uncharacterized protein B0I36DRAFT_426187 [Microdochium trichocladiopsis]|uniref:DNA/RNA-binding domain-containing protein n=1 Tax=Microdochium trichocladiopsis TaxID=1682393 RepID=A0A9P8XQZ9_9PEZI|nr:uncharacterized protein B0I36DRAFT_426187 [Microdochium trichocladiopsis]KAH7009083.1 hypothetical protein B0I36DRAFT_426187 [Microdochium trichocladiopsis]
MSEGKGIDNSYTSFLRRSAKISCSLGGCGKDVDAIESTIREHINSAHSDMLSTRDLAVLVSEFRRIKSPNSSARARGRSSSPQRRSRAAKIGHDADFRRSTTSGGSLWTPQKGGSSKKPTRPRVAEPLPAAVEKPFKQLETRPISQDQLVAEVKGIYAGLVMVESKCIEVDNAQSSQNDAKLNNEQWQALIALHRTLLHEHHDFFLASQHPAASPALKRLATKYGMPARMWRHGIHSFLELLRHRLPASLEHMLTFIYLAYSMMALLYETVPAFEDTWMECLGDISRYRMGIDDDDFRDREIWTSVSRHWYSRASDKSPPIGRLYHHLAILARPNTLQQLFYYTKSLCVPAPFLSARESILTLFDPLLKRSSKALKLASIDTEYVKCHGILFTGQSRDELKSTTDRFIAALDNHITKIGRRWMEFGYYTAVANSCAIMGYGKEDNFIAKAFQQKAEPAEAQTLTQEATPHDTAPDPDVQDALRLANGTAGVVLKRRGDDSVFPFFHVSLAFLYHAAQYNNVVGTVGRSFPWELVCELLNSMLLSYRTHERLQSKEFPLPAGRATPRPLPEDFAMKGLTWTTNYYPDDFFADDKIDDDEKYFEVASMIDERRERILWLATRLARDQHWLAVNESFTTFSLLDATTNDAGHSSIVPSDVVMTDADKPL